MGNMTEMSVPRTKSGGRYRQYGSDAYAVVLGADGAEISERHTGHLWIALSPQGGGTRVDILFVDDRGSSSSAFALTSSASSLRVGLFADGEAVADVLTSAGYYSEGCVLSVDWSTMFAEMR